MGARGPRPTPTEVLKRRGSSLVPKRRRQREPKAPPGRPSCPSWLSGRGKELFAALLKELELLGVLGKSDRTAIALLADAQDQYLSTRETIEEEGETFTTDKGYVGQHPAVAMRTKAWDRVMRGCREFGLTPSARVGVKAAEQDVPSNDDKKPKLRVC